MKKAIITISILSLFLNCALFEKLAFKSIITMYPSKRHSIRYADGFKGDYYTFTLGDKNKIDTYIFVAQGSGYGSAQWFRYYFNDLPGNVKVYSLQKRYVKHNDSHVDKPSNKYQEYNCLSHTIADQTEFINSILSDITLINNKIVMFGVSEGAMVASAVASNIPEITHLVVLGDGGMKGIDAFRIWGQRNDNDFDQIYKIVIDDPASDKFIGPYSHKYWKDILDEDPMEHISKLNIPMFYCMGDKDESVPIESLYYLLEEFSKLKKDNLTTKIYPGCNHSLEDSTGKSYKKEFMQEIYNWLHT